MNTAQRERVGVIGSGNFGRALAKRLFNSGYDVIIGSRTPGRISIIDECLCNIVVTSFEDCLKQVSLVFLAVHVGNFRDCLKGYEDLFDGKIVVDVSNRQKIKNNSSNAEYLCTLIPNSTVVKAFNVISAYAMENCHAGGSQQVFIAGNDRSARERVSVIARNMGFVAVDYGLLISSRRIEAYPLKIFPGWKVPLAFTVGVFNIWALYIVFIYFIKRTAYRWDQIFIKVLNKPLCMTAITVFACTFLPSSLAYFVQLYYGTKHVTFPKWLNRWLLSRKQLGLIAFTLICIHVLISVLIMSPTYLSSWFQSTTITVPGNRTDDIKIKLKTWMVWKGEAACLAGIVSFVLICIMAISTLPSVTNTLNWKEWRFIQSRLGHIALFLSVVHVIIMGAPGWAKNTPLKTLQSITFLSLIIPFLTIFLRMFFCLPCVHKHLKKIHRGWERSYADCRAKCSRRMASSGQILSKDTDTDDHTAMMIFEEDDACACSSTSVV